jgi:hypothetical protein
VLQDETLQARSAEAVWRVRRCPACAEKFASSLVEKFVAADHPKCILAAHREKRK